MFAVQNEARIRNQSSGCLPSICSSC